jgi:hypothetical protein
MKNWSGICFILLVAVLFATVPTSYASACTKEKENHESNKQYAERQPTHEKTHHKFAEKESHDNHSCPIGGCGDDCNCGCGCVHSQTSIFIGFGIKSLISNALFKETLPEISNNLALQTYHTDIWQPPKC